MNPNPFTKQGKGYRVRPVKWLTVDKWLEGAPVSFIEKDGNKYHRSVCTYRKALQSVLWTAKISNSMYTVEIQKQFIKN